jgi:hypothetical protein
MYAYIYIYIYIYILNQLFVPLRTQHALYDDDGDVCLEKITTRGVTESNPTQKCRPAKSVSIKQNESNDDEFNNNYDDTKHNDEEA